VAETLRRIKAVCIATLANGRRLEGREAQELLAYVMDEGWPGDLSDVPVFAYRYAEVDEPEANIAVGEIYLVERTDA
jgi:hypothetical protein